MSQQANIVLNDGQTVPVAKTFSPKGALKSLVGKVISAWREQSALNADGFLSITEHFTPKNSNSVQKFRWVFEIPTLETVGTNDAGITPAPKVAYTTNGVIEFWINTRASQQELKDIVAYVKNFAATAYMSDAILKREHAW